MWSTTDEFAEYARELKSTHANASSQSPQPVFRSEHLDQLLSRGLDPLGVPTEASVREISRLGARRIQVCCDNQIDDPLIKRQIATLMRQPIQAPSQKS